MLDPEFHPGSHNMLDENAVKLVGPESESESSRPWTPPARPGEGTLLDDMAEDLGIPLRLKDLRRVFDNAVRQK